MNVLKFRQILAEIGQEKTPQEAGEILILIRKIRDKINSLSYEVYLGYISMDEEEIRQMAQETGEDYEDMVMIIEVIRRLGKMKFDH